MKLLVLSLSLIHLFSLSAISQVNQMLPCRVTLQNGGVMNGTVNVIRSKNTPLQFEFYGSNGSHLLITPENAASVEIADSIVYRSAKVKIYENIVNGNVLSERPDELPKEGNFFMERMIKGKPLNLYIIEEERKTHFIIEDSSGNIQSLRYLKYIESSDETSYLRDLPYYKTQLQAFVPAGNYQARKKILGTSFTEEGIINTIVSINYSNELNKRAAFEIRKRPIFFLFAEAGAGILNVHFRGVSERFNKLKFQPAIVPEFVAGVDMRPGRDERFLAELFASVYHYSFTGESTYANSSGMIIQDTYQLSATPLTIGLFANYTLFKTGNLRLALGAGYALVINNLSKNNLSTTDKNPNGSYVIVDQVQLSSTSGQYLFDADLFLNSKISLHLVYFPNQSFSGQNYYSFKTSLFSANIKYRLH